jgi:hypothetical protein
MVERADRPQLGEDNASSLSCRVVTDIVIVNYKTANLCCRAIDSLVAELSYLPHVAVTVVDNDSDDGSYQKIAEFIASHSYAAVVLTRPSWMLAF